MNEKLIKFNLAQRKNKNIPGLQSGDIVKVHRKIVEGKKERIQVFEGIIIAINGRQSSSPTITVRKVSNSVGVEIVLPIYSSGVEKIEIVKRAKVRRSKLYYIRDKSAKSLRLKYKDMAEFVAAEEEGKEDVSDEKADEDKKEDKNDKDKKAAEDNKEIEIENGKSEASSTKETEKKK